MITPVRIRTGMMLGLLSLGACHDAQAPTESATPQPSIQSPTGLPARTTVPHARVHQQPGWQ